VASVFYALCALTSAGCAGLLARGYRRGPTRLLLWSTLCFVGLAINNGLLFLDLVLVPSVDLSLLRGLTGLGSLLILLYGLIWDRR
jgi:hydrogenase/urease accessory protein HupE